MCECHSQVKIVFRIGECLYSPVQEFKEYRLKYTISINDSYIIMQKDSNISLGYRIKLIIAKEKNSIILYNNEIIVPSVYPTLEEIKQHIELDIKQRLKASNYFRSYKKGFDLVCYSNECTNNTYLAYRIIPIHPSTEPGLKILSEA